MILQPGSEKFLIVGHTLLEIKSAVFQLIQNIVTGQVHIVRRDDKGVGGDAFDFSVIGIGYAAEEIHNAARDLFFRLFQIEHHRMALEQLIRHGSGFLSKGDGLEQYHCAFALIFTTRFPPEDSLRGAKSEKE